MNKLTLGASVTLMALTLGLVTHAESTAVLDAEMEASIQQEINLVEEAPSEKEEAFLDTILEEAFETEKDVELSDALSKHKGSFHYNEKGGLDAKNAFCERFIDENGNYGVYGKVISDYLQKKLRLNASTPMLADDVPGMEKQPKICPNWRSFSDAEKIKFWVWTFAAISASESTCGANPRAIQGVKGIPVYGKGKNGKRVIVRYKRAIGILQMEKARQDRDWRGLKGCDVGPSEIGKTLHNLRCGTDVMEWSVEKGWPIYPGKGMDTNGYWQHLRIRGGGPIGEKMRAFSPCFGRPNPIKAQPSGPRIAPGDANPSPFRRFLSVFSFPVKQT